MEEKLKKGNYYPCAKWPGSPALLSDARLVYQTVLRFADPGSPEGLAARAGLKNVPVLIAQCLRVAIESTPPDTDIDESKLSALDRQCNAHLKALMQQVCVHRMYIDTYAYI
jgi:hypothetical protein